MLKKIFIIILICLNLQGAQKKSEKAEDWRLNNFFALDFRETASIFSRYDLYIKQSGLHDIAIRKAELIFLPGSFFDVIEITNIKDDQIIKTSDDGEIQSRTWGEFLLSHNGRSVSLKIEKGMKYTFYVQNRERNNFPDLKYFTTKLTESDFPKNYE